MAVTTTEIDSIKILLGIKGTTVYDEDLALNVPSIMINLKASGVAEPSVTSEYRILYIQTIAYRYMLNTMEQSSNSIIESIYRSNVEQLRNSTYDLEVI